MAKNLIVERQPQINFDYFNTIIENTAKNLILERTVPN